jgi:hypothetical protein
MSGAMTPEPLARKIMETAIAEGRAGEMMDCLFSGGSCTLDRATGKLALISGDQLTEIIKSAASSPEQGMAS